MFHRLSLVGLIWLCAELSWATTPTDELAPPVQAPVPADAPRLTLSHCLVSLIDDVEVPAQSSGALRAIAVTEGASVEQGALLAQIDERRAQFEYATAAAEAKAARSKADNVLDTEYATAEYHVKEAEYRMSAAANAKEPNSVSLVELERLRLAAEQARIKISVSSYERGLRAIEAEGFAAKADQAQVDLEHRRILAPVAGEIVEVFYRPGEWVESGKAVLRIVRLDRLRIEGFLPFAGQDPDVLLHRPVVVRAALAGGRSETFTGKITFVSPLVQPGGEYRIWAEVDNRRRQDRWILKPGIEAEMELSVAP